MKSLAINRWRLGMVPTCWVVFQAIIELLLPKCDCYYSTLTVMVPCWLTNQNTVLWSPVSMDIAPNLKFWEHFRRRVANIARGKGLDVCIEKNISLWLTYICKGSLTWLPKTQLNNIDVGRHTKWKKKKNTHKNSTLHNAENGRNNLLYEEHTIWLSNNELSVLKTYILVTLYWLSRLYI